MVDSSHDAPPTDSDEPGRHFTDRRFTIQGAIGLGTIVGNVGVLGVFTPHERISLVAGGGITPWGVQWGAGLRFRALIWPGQKIVQALTIAPGFTLGNWESMNDHLHGEDQCDPQHDEYCTDGPFTSPPRNYYIRRIDHARWAQLDVGYEMRTRPVSVFAGPFLAMALNPEDCVLEPADIQGTFPERFYATTNQDTEIRIDGDWVFVQKQEMDCGIRVNLKDKSAECVPMSDVQVGDLIVIGRTGTRVKPTDRDRAHGSHDAFSFMNSTVSSEKPKGVTVREIAAAS